MVGKGGSMIISKRNSQRTVVDYFNDSDASKICTCVSDGTPMITGENELYSHNGDYVSLIWDEWGDYYDESSVEWLETNT
jgi:hypothetical protein